MKKIRVRTLASGDSLSINVYDFRGTQKGAPTAYLQSAMHGSEVQGSLVIALLTEYLSKNPPLGDIRLVPNCNPQAVSEKGAEYTLGRFDMSTGDNFNRQYFLPTKNFHWERFQRRMASAPEEKIFATFRNELRKSIRRQMRAGASYAARLSLTLQTLSVDFDHCLDLHCANKSVRHVYAPAYAEQDTSYLGVRLQILMANDKFGGSMDEVFFRPWTQLAEKLGTRIPVQSFTVELGSHEEVSRAAALKDMEGILNYLRHRGVIRGKAKKFKAISCPQANYLIVHAPIGGITEFLAEPGKPIKKGATMARILVFKKRPMFFEVKCPADGIVTLHHSSCIVNEGAELYRVITKV